MIQINVPAGCHEDLFGSRGQLQKIWMYVMFRNLVRIFIVCSVIILIQTVENDTFFGPALSKRMHDAHTGAGAECRACVRRSAVMDTS